MELTTMETITLGFVFIMTLAVIWFIKFTQMPGNFPKGPTQSLVYGNVLTCWNNRHRLPTYFKELGEKYGSVVGMRFFNKPVIVLNDLKVLKDILSDPVYSNRGTSSSYIMKQIFEKHGQIRGIIFADGSIWEENKRLAIKALKNYGMGRGPMVKLINTEMSFLSSELKKFLGKPFDIRNVVTFAMYNVIFKICFNKRYDYGNREFQQFVTISSETLDNISTASFVNYVPMARFLPSDKWYCKLAENMKYITDMIMSNVKDHKQSFDAENIRDLADIMLNEELGTKYKNNETSDENIKCCMIDMFGAGAGTTASLIYWVILQLILHPIAQDKCHQEINRVVGDREASMDDLPNLPYIKGVVHEVLRLNAGQGFAVRRTIKTTKLNGYDIPKHTMVYANFCTFHMDPEIWENPEEFNPERWIGKDGKFHSNKVLLSFGHGNRMCIADRLAKMTVCLFITAMLQQFKFSIADEEHVPTLEPRLGTTRNALPYDVIISQH